jgi:SAM-dependent methyltransferase
LTAATFRALASNAAARYPARDRFAFHFAKGKLTGDPVFAHLLEQRLVPAGSRVLDLGCGQGLLAVLLDLGGARPASFHGIDLRGRDIARARAAMPEAQWVEGDIRTSPFPPSDVVVILDVLHYIAPDEQRQVLERVRESLRDGGTLLLRVADGDGSLRFRYTLFVDRLVTALRGGHWPTLHTRPLDGWRTLLEGLGFTVRTEPMSQGTPFANVLCVARYKA